MLPAHYRISARNVSSTGGATYTFLVTAKRWKYDTDGSLIYDTEDTICNESGVATGAWTSATAEDNTSGLWLGAHLTITVTPSASTSGSAIVQVQHSTDGGTTWPSDGRGHVSLGGAVFVSTATAVRFNAVID